MRCGLGGSAQARQGGADIDRLLQERDERQTTTQAGQGSAGTADAKIRTSY